jgi:sterol desaturase/sphingolipid hydroxylase (fatty acid hydroxylase superfamily)
MRDLIDAWVFVQDWIFETFVMPALYATHLMAWDEPAFGAVEFFMLGVVQIAVIALGMRLLERRWPLERGADDRLVRVDVVYTVLNKLGILPLVIFIVTLPITNTIEYLARAWGFVPFRIEHIAPWLQNSVLVTFLIYFVLYDFAAYWVHRAQHRISWWWALHSLHHSQRRLTVWSDDRNHIFDETLVNLVLVIFAQLIGVQPSEYVSILLVGRLIESWSHANVDVGFGWLGDRLLVGPRFHRVHHARASAQELHIHDSNFAPVFPIWDILFGTAVYDGKCRPTGVDDPVIDADNGRGWIAQQVMVFGRFLSALVPGRLRRA